MKLTGRDAAGATAEYNRYYADHGGGELRIFADAGRNAAGEPVLTDVVTLHAPEDRDPDGVLRAYGWIRINSWIKRGDGRDGRRVAMVEPSAPDPALAQLERDQLIGEERRAALGWTPDCEDRWAGTSPQFLSTTTERRRVDRSYATSTTRPSVAMLTSSA